MAAWRPSGALLLLGCAIRGVWACPLGASRREGEGTVTGRAAALLTALARLGRSFPRATVGALALLFAASLGSAYGYAVHLTEEARAELRDGHVEEAKRDLRVCRWLRPFNGRVRLLAARATRLSGDIPGAEAQLQQCLKLEHGATADIQLEFLLLRVQTGEVDQVEAQLLVYVDKRDPGRALDPGDAGPGPHAQLPARPRAGGPGPLDRPGAGRARHGQGLFLARLGAGADAQPQ